MTYIAKYDYCRPDNSVAYTIQRTETKQFIPITDTGQTSLEGVVRYPYNLPALLAETDTVIVVEGEKSCDHLISLGFTATCSAGGSKWSWPKEWRQYFKHLKRVIVIADNDQIGLDCAQTRARLIKSIVDDTRVLELSGLAPKEDVYDWLTSHNHDPDDLWKVIEYCPTMKLVEPRISINVEDNLIAYMLIEKTENTKIARTLTSTDFEDRFYGSVFNIIVRMTAVGLPADPTSVAASTARDGTCSQDVAEQKLWKLYSQTFDWENLPTWIDTQLDNATRRSVETAAHNVLMLSKDGVTGEQLVKQWDSAVIRKKITVTEASPNIDDILAVDEKFDWLLPNFMERKDRFMFVAPEGAGKAVWLRQTAIRAAAGIDVWDDTKRQTPVRVLMIDRENSPAQIRRQTQRSYETAKKLVGSSWSKNFMIQSNPSSINICNPDDRNWLESQIIANKPELVFLMPIYKLFEDGNNNTAERNAQEFTKVVDDLRERYGISIMMEHHSPFGDGMKERKPKPFGSTVWLRWPDYCWGLIEDERQQHYKVYPNRGDRTPIYRPSKMNWNPDLSQGWPWEHTK